MAYRPTARTELIRQQQREALLATAHHLLTTGGFGALSITTVAAGAGLATGSFYRHFSGKAELCAELFRQATEKEIDVVSRLATQSLPAKERLIKLICAFCQRAIRGRVQAYALIAEPIDPLVEAERLRYRNTYTQLFSQLIIEGIKSGEFPAQHTQVSAAALVGALAETLVGPLAMHLQKNTDFNNEEEQQLIENICVFCLRAITGKEK